MNKSIIILGGGTAGWMCANLLQHALGKFGFNISLIESPEIGIIGVGEGSTPHLRNFFSTLGISESQWMPKCNATYKNGISFDGWSQQQGYDNYFHPFPSLPDRQTAGGFLINCHLRRQGHQVDSHPNQYFLAAHLSKNNLSPKPKGHSPIRINYGYHFDSALLGSFLKDFAIKQGVTHVTAKIEHVEQHLSGDIAHLMSDQGETFSANWFVDCSGFTSKLLQQTLKVKFKEFTSNLFNNAAVAMPSKQSEVIAVQTKASALSNGWKWQIPLTNRIGNGYVYSNDYINSEQAETELRRNLGLLDSDIEAKHLKMRVGQVSEHWHKNCLAVGLSQGFIEPLEATALHLVQDTIESFISAFEAGRFTTQHQHEFNQRISAKFEGIRDYIVCHYKVSSRTDSHYWLDNAQNNHLSDSLQLILDCWDKGADLSQEIQRQNIQHYYPAVSWHCLLAGYGRFGNLGAVNAPSHEVNTQEISRYIKQCANQFLTHNKALEQSINKSR